MSTSLDPSRHDHWADGAVYERFMGRWSRLVAGEFLPWLGVPPGARWLDVGCGTGILSRAILESAQPVSLKGIDRSVGLLALARIASQDRRASFEPGDAQYLPVETGAYDAVVSGLLLNFLPQPELGAAEMVRLTRPGGCVAAYVWDYAGKMELLRYFWDAAAALDPQARGLDEGRRFPLCQPEALQQLFQQAGLRHVQVRSIDVATRFSDFDDYWSPFLSGEAPAPGYVKSLRADRQAALRQRLLADLPFTPGGSIPLVARAWAVCGIK